MSPAPLSNLAESRADYFAKNIAIDEQVIVVPGEDPFYFASGRRLHFPVMLFDKGGNAFSPTQLLEMARASNIQWFVVKTDLQLHATVSYFCGPVIDMFRTGYELVYRLSKYDIYHRRGE